MLSLTELRLQLSLQLPAPFLELLQLLLCILATVRYKDRRVNGDPSDGSRLDAYSLCRADRPDEPGHRLRKTDRPLSWKVSRAQAFPTKLNHQ